MLSKPFLFYLLPPIANWNGNKERYQTSLTRGCNNCRYKFASALKHFPGPWPRQLPQAAMSPWEQEEWGIQRQIDQTNSIWLPVSDSWVNKPRAIKKNDWRKGEKRHWRHFVPLMMTLMWQMRENLHQTDKWKLISRDTEWDKIAKRHLEDWFHSNETLSPKESRVLTPLLTVCTLGALPLWPFSDPPCSYINTRAEQTVIQSRSVNLLWCNPPSHLF